MFYEEIMKDCVFWIILLITLTIVMGFISETTYVIGKKIYKESFEQPWFRVPHYTHKKVEASEKDSSAFGKHFIPENDIFMSPDWTAEEAKFLKCMNRECVCPFFNGTIVKSTCILPTNQPLKRAYRQEIRTLSDKKRKEFESTLNWMKQMGIYNRLSRVHKYSGVHSGPAFTIWHREFLKRMELVIRHYLPDTTMGIPYWDSTLDSLLPDPHDSIIFSDIFLGEVDSKGFVTSGPYANWTTMEGRPHIFRQFHSDPSGELLNNARVDWLINNPDLNVILGTTMPLTTCPINVTLDARILEYSHDYVHFFISGDMGKSFSSSNDVIFIYHHSMIDLIFETWRQNQQTRIQRELEYPPSNKNCFPPWHFIDSPMPMLQPFKNRDALSNAYTDEIYEFAPRPTCSRENRDCDGSKYLFCVVPPKADAFCMSKVKLGGNCTGFEGTQICYEGYCSRGICQHGTSTEKESILHKHKLNM